MPTIKMPKEMNELMLKIMRKEISICETCDTLFAYRPRKIFCDECNKKKAREYRERPEVKAKRREYHARPEHKAKRREYRQRPEVKAMQREYQRRPEHKAKRREYHARPEHKAKRRERDRIRHLRRKQETS